ncbi:hypothetical protein PGT21_018264 [Puccinia graminis f. sp. tritici]|uniref:Uncharacterized protein n=1 Tax=Puccinia graminis f. sp. tritici TaxID=56615 RepID=A0A5B0ML10_PUCGR|nr:hypothetical protein PGT21_018264 [Puccinia graminis f. sp. tritici]
MGPMRLSDGEIEALLSPSAIKLGTSLIPSLIQGADGVNPVQTSSAIMEELANLTGLFHSLRLD